MTRLRIVIVNWNSGAQLEACLASIVKADKQNFQLDRVVVVDNASTDHSLWGIQELPLPLDVIRNTENRGFAAACNQGAREAVGDYVLFLNPDAALYEDTLAKVMTYMEAPENFKVGICGVRLIDESGQVARSCARFPSTLRLVLLTVGMGKFVPRLQHNMADWDHEQTREVDHVIGAFFLVRGAVYKALDGFDERFFVYFEDLDFSLRVSQTGWKSVYFADAQAFHAGGGTSRQIKARRLFYTLRSRLLYAHKNFSKVGLVFVVMTTLFVEPLSRSGLALFRRSWSGLKETWIAYGMLMRWLPAWIFKGQTR